jgi:hypothetical protein
MSTLLRFIPRVGASIDPRQDRLVAEPEITIGRAPDCGLQLRRNGLRYHHAVLREDGDSITLEALPGAVLRKGDADVQRARLSIGDSVRVGPFIFSAVAPDETSGADHVVTVTAAEENVFDEVVQAKSYIGRFDVSLPNIRLAAFITSVLVFVLFFLVPIVFGPLKPGDSWTTKAGRTEASLEAHEGLFHSARLWNVGEISGAHKAFGTNCKSCHETPFIPVRSSTCLSCHATIGQHADPHLAPAADLNQERCESCHHEHKGMTLATKDDQADCVSCHGALKNTMPATKLRDVTDFGSGHPEFAVSLVQDAATHSVARFALDDKNAVDNSHLKFTHMTHLKLDKVKKAGAEKGSTCATCHEEAPGGMVFKPVSYDKNCAECHQLQFEPKHPEWRLPHGHPDDVANRLRGYYSEAALRNETFPAPSSDIFAKPGADLPPPPPTGAEMVSAQTANAMMSSIARSACGECHVTAPPEAGADPSAWKILPVYVPDRFLPKAQFRHDKHDTMSCQGCHAAESSDGGVQALIPSIETCKGCHAGENGAPQRIATRCVSCHVFHNPEHPIIGVRAATATTETTAK